MRKLALLSLLTAVALEAHTVYVLKTSYLYGRCSIQAGDIIIKHPALDIKIPRYVKVITCSNLECMDYETNRLKHSYNIEEIK